MKDGAKIKYRISLTMSVLMAMLCAVLSGTVMGRENKAEMTADSVKEEYHNVKEEDIPLYRVVAEEGYVRIHDIRKPENSRVLEEIDARMLRKSDLTMLEKGLELYNDDELASFLEDFGS